VLAARTPDRLDGATASVTQTNGTQAIGVPTHVDDPHEAVRLVDRAVDHFGRLDAVVNAAGHAPLAPIDRTTPEMLDKAFRVNALGSGYVIARAWPIFLRQGHGRIVNISSMATQDPFPGFFAYAAAKAAVNLMARSCAIEGRDHGIKAFAIAPGAVETPMLRALFDEQQIPTDSTLSPEEVAEEVVACVTGKRDEQSGQTIWLPNG